MNETRDSLSNTSSIIDEYEIIIPELSAGVRIDRYLGDCVEVPATRSKIQQALKSNRVTVNGEPVSASFKLTGGEQVAVILTSPENLSLEPENIPLDIIFEDEQLLVVNKPSGMVTHPAPGARSGTLVHALMGRGGSLSQAQGAERAGIVHRLDKATTGLLIVAKTDSAHLNLQKQLKDRTLKRTYLALACGHLKEDEGEINAPIGRSIKDRKKMTVTNVASRVSVTHYRILERFKSYDLLKVTLQTGRTHQIRVHLTYLGHPVFGDADYGGRESWHKGLFGPERLFGIGLLKEFPRQALHAGEIAFIHPESGESIELETPPPKDFLNLIEKVRNHR